MTKIYHTVRDFAIVAVSEVEHREIQDRSVCVCYYYVCFIVVSFGSKTTTNRVCGPLQLVFLFSVTWPFFF